MAEDNRTEAELIELALEAQDACNLIAVANAFARAIKRLRVIANEEGWSIEWVFKHRVCRLFADKIKSLTGDTTWADFG